MTTYYKATRPDGTDFYSGDIDYGAALLSGEVIRHPKAKKVRDAPATYLSVSVEPADCTGFSWPCRLFRVEPVGRVMSNLSASQNKRAVSALRVVEELPAHMALGPHGEAVAALIERAEAIAPEDAKRLAAAWADAAGAAGAAGVAAGAAGAAGAAADAAADAAAAAAAAWEAAWEAVAAAGAAGAAADAAWALVVRDFITPEQFDILYGPWASVMETA